MDENNLTPLDLLEHERFHGFFDVAVAELTAKRKEITDEARAAGATGRVLRRSAYDALKEQGLFDNEDKRKAEIYLCAQKRSKLSKRERDMLEYLTVQAGAKLIAWSHREKANVISEPDESKTCHICGKETEVFECQRCGELFCSDCSATYEQFTQIDYDCCERCYMTKINADTE